MTITLENIEPILSNPEDMFNDLIKDGWSVNDALKEIMTEGIVENRLSREYPDYSGTSYSYGNNSVDIVLEPWESLN